MSPLRRHLRFGIVAWALAVHSVPASADWLYLNETGLGHIDAIREAIAPAPLFPAADGAPGKWYIRGIVQRVVNLLPATPSPASGESKKLQYARPEDVQKLLERSKAANAQSQAASTTRITVVAFGERAARRSNPVEFSAGWFTVVQELDSLRDLQKLVGNFDEAFSTSPGSRRYTEHLLAAIDPDGAMGLAPSRGPAVAPAVALVPGFLVEQIRWNRLPEPARLQAALEHRKREVIAGQQLGYAESPSMFAVHDWIVAIARARAYTGNVERGFADGLTAALSTLLRLRTLEPGRFAGKTMPDNADHLTAMATGALDQIARVIEGARPGANSDPRLVPLIDWANQEVGPKLPLPLPERRAAVLAEFTRRLATLPPPAKNRDHRHWTDDDPQFPVDPSQIAAVALELLKATDALCFEEAFTERFTFALLTLESEPPGPDPRAGDRVRLRSIALDVLERLLRPSRLSSRTGEACQLTAGAARRVVFNTAYGGGPGSSPALRAFALDVLRRAGWGPRAEVVNLTRQVFYRNRGGDNHFSRADTEEARAQRAAFEYSRRRQLQDDAKILAAVAALNRSPDAELRSAAEDLQQLMNDVESRGSSDGKQLLEAYRALAAGKMP